MAFEYSNYTRLLFESPYNTSQRTFTCSKLTIETLEQGVRYVQKLTIKTPERRLASFWCLYC